MLTRLLHRNIASVESNLLLLAPRNATIPSTFENVDASVDRHADLLTQMQRMRGGIYLRDGALRAEDLSPDGRHDTPEDHRAWHLLIQNEQGSLTGCIWYLEHETPPTFDQLRLRHSASALLRQTDWGPKLRAAVKSDVAQAVKERIHYAEVGGWAVDRTSRLADCLLLVLGTYGLSQFLGGAFVVATATVRHASATVLRRLGGSHLQGDGFAVPSYYDPRYDCEMEVLRFDTRRPSSKYATMVASIKAKFDRIPVIAHDAHAAEASGFDRDVSIASGLAAQPQHRLAVA
jgi:hypothetical protein